MSADTTSAPAYVPPTRSDVLDGLFAILAELDDKPGLPTDTSAARIEYIVQADSDEDGIAEVRRIADLLGVEVDASSGHYRAVKEFGPARYKAVYISKADWQDYLERQEREKQWRAEQERRVSTVDGELTADELPCDEPDCGVLLGDIVDGTAKHRGTHCAGVPSSDRIGQLELQAAIEHGPVCGCGECVALDPVQAYDDAIQDVVAEATEEQIEEYSQSCYDRDENPDDDGFAYWLLARMSIATPCANCGEPIRPGLVPHIAWAHEGTSNKLCAGVATEAEPVGAGDFVAVTMTPTEAAERRAARGAA